MRTIHTQTIIETVARLCVEANTDLPCDVQTSLCCAGEAETDPTPQAVFGMLTENARIARDEAVPICQDTGAAIVFLEIGQDVRIVGGFLGDVVNEGVRQGYADLRKSMVRDPIDRVNTGDNTPAILITDIVPGDRLTITLAPKGFGSENMSALAMLKPSAGWAGAADFIVETVRKAGGNPCPPIVVGVGIGGTADSVMLLAKRALLRNLDVQHPDPTWAARENELLDRINALHIGAAGFGGVTTALGVNLLAAPTHIAGLPVGVNICCHACRHRQWTIEH